MNAIKNRPCPCCGEGFLHQVSRDYAAKIGDGQIVKIPNLPMEVCDQCGEEILTLEAARAVDAVIASDMERLAPEELTALRESFGLDKTQMSEALGLGGKIYLRWEQGSQYPSRSMSCYLRVLREFPEAFEWLRSRSWQE
jgi:putative zinc finger/helix-turn-helix YgiT family protein